MKGWAGHIAWIWEQEMYIQFLGKGNFLRVTNWISHFILYSEDKSITFEVCLGTADLYPQSTNTALKEMCNTVICWCTSV